jgi:transcriptional regulator with XRE-family HTH domain
MSESGEMLRKFRESFGLSQKDFGKKLGISQQLVDYHEVKAEKLNRKHLAKILKTFDCNNEDFINIVTEKQILTKSSIDNEKKNVDNDKKIIDNLDGSNLLELHDQIIEARTESRVYRDIIDKYFGRLETSLSKMERLTIKNPNVVTRKNLEHKKLPRR